MQRHPSHIRTRQAEAQSLKMQIQKLLSWTELEYGQFQYDSGIEYLRRYIPTDPQGIDLLTRNKTFWNWWKNQWANRDIEFLQDDYAGISQRHRVDYYRSKHSASQLAREITPNGKVLGDGYAQMIGDLIDQKA